MTLNAGDGETYFNFTGKDQILVTINSGRDGFTSAKTIEKAAATFTKVYLETQGDIKTKATAAANAANEVVKGSKQTADIGDRVQSETINPTP